MTRRVSSSVLLLALLACGPLPTPTVVPAPPTEQIVGRLLLLGDGGHPAVAAEPVLTAARTLLAPFGDRGTLVLLGDNIYPRGLPDPAAPDFAEMSRRLLAQLDAGLGAGADVIAVPGNHDWDKSGPDGLVRIRRAAASIAAHDARAALLPGDACPGPAVARSGAGIRVLALDTQWFLHPHEKPTTECAVHDLATLGAALRASLAADTAVTIVIAHHPLRTQGVHGGYFDWKQHLFPLRELHEKLWIPLPLIGSLYPIIRGSGIAAQDLTNARNRAMTDTLLQALAPVRPLLYASGHEHNLQLFEDADAGLLAVSGAGFFGHESAVFPGNGLRFGSPKSGGMYIDRLMDGRIRLGVFTVDRAGAAREVYSRWLR